MPIRVYHYPRCSTCKKALRWLEGEGIEAQAIHIVESPPSKALLRRVLRGSGLPLRKLFNTSGGSYREGGWRDRLPQLSEAEALEALAADPMLIKRPLVEGEGIHLVGFDAAAWAEAFDRK
ncbi:MAG: Spx/MgsR family RNA polymerase-binding regulatory protein [Myxococcales bacterium]|nr:Spx/MgsR family RNA polymerase-binding regulatory protein [Myxococcales bacterium]